MRFGCLFFEYMLSLLFGFDLHSTVICKFWSYEWLKYSFCLFGFLKVSGDSTD